jgi:DNA-binding NarL/FixJ family response regulator
MHPTAGRPAEWPVRVVLCDDHVVVLEGLKSVLEAAEGIEVVGLATDGEAGVEATLRLRPDVVLMDLAMPKLDGTEATRRIVARAPEIRVVVLTSFAEHARVLEAIDAGAVGYILKDSTTREHVRAIRAAAAGEAPLDPRVALAVVPRHTTADPAPHLSEREREVLSLLAAGLPTRAIACRLAITEATVRAHLTHIYRQIGATDRTQAALWAIGHGLHRS